MEASEFKSVFLPFQPKMYRVAYSILHNAQDAEDIVQEAFLRLWKKRNDSDISFINEAYCVIVVRNLCMDFIRGSHSADEDSINENIIPLYEDVEAKLEARDDVRILRKLISGLPEIQRKVVILRDVNEYSFEEIEKVTGLGAINIRATLSKARKKLREKFNEIIG